MQLTQSQAILAEEPSPVFYAGRKLSEVEQALLWSVLPANADGTISLIARAWAVRGKT